MTLWARRASGGRWHIGVVEIGAQAIVLVRIACGTCWSRQRRCVGVVEVGAQAVVFVGIAHGPCVC